MRQIIQKHPWIPLAAITLLALFLRLGICLALWQTPAVQSPDSATDMATYLRLSRQISAGIWPDHFDYQPFYYTVFLPAARLLSGNSPWGYQFLQILLGTATVFLTGWTAAHLLHRKAGWIAALLLALCRLHIFYTPFALFEVLQAFWISLLLALLLFIHQREKNLSLSAQCILWGICALILACAILTRGNALLLLPAPIALLWYHIHRQQLPRGKKMLRGSLFTALILLLTFLPQLPFSLTNAQYTGRWCGPSTAGEKVLALGNGPEATPGGLEYPLTYHSWTQQAESRSHRIPMRTRLLQWMRQEPLLFLNLQWEKLLLFWDHQEIPNNVSLEGNGYPRAPWLRGLLPTWLIFSLGLLGLMITWKNPSPMKCLLYGGVLLLWFSTSLFYILSRFRLCILPWCCIFAAAGLLWLRETPWRAAKENRKLLLTRILPVLLALFLTRNAFSLWHQQITPGLYRLCRPEGTVVSDQNRMRIYDHGPLTFCSPLQIASKESYLLEKRLVIPAHSSSTSAEIRLAVLPPSTPTYTGKTNSFLEYQGIFYPLRYCQEGLQSWLIATVPATLPEGVISLRWHLAPGTTFYLDSYRQYQRSLPQELAGEIAAEIDLLF